MEEIKVGEYVRTKAGFIRKIDKIENCPICKEKEYINKEIIRGLHFQNTYHKKDITKHSFNIIDLIEVGDYVNGVEVIHFQDDIFNSYYELANHFLISRKKPEDIKTILTKEQYKANAYSLE